MASDPVRTDATDDDERGDFFDVSSPAVLGANPFVGLSARQMMASLSRLLRHLGARPGVIARETVLLGRDLTVIAAGRTPITPPRSDKRWSDPAWSENPVYKRLQQSYLAYCAAVGRAIASAGLDRKSELRGRYATGILTEALAPTNSPVNPAVLKRLFDTSGKSAVTGVGHFLSDLVKHRGMPTTVDRRPFGVGESVAVSPGGVVFRNDVLEVLQYTPTTPQAREIPLLFVPPQINKFYILDLAPGRSFTEYAVGRGIPFFTVSWRNPTPAQRDWDLSTYAGAVLEATEAVRAIAGTDTLNLLGLCAGGMTVSALLGHLAATGQLNRVPSATFLVTMIDTSGPSQIGDLASQPVVDEAIEKARRKGVFSGADMERGFAWLRPSDLVWNYVVNNWLLGKEPPAFDVLAWNADTTELPAALYEQFVQLYRGNQLRQPGGMTVLGTPLDLGKVDIDTYSIAGVTDHIVSWKAAYEMTNIFSGPVEFVLSNSGHIQALVNPPGNPKASLRVGGRQSGDAEQWLATSREVRGSWWEHWCEWILARSGAERPAPESLGDADHPVLMPAPGSYVLG